MPRIAGAVNPATRSTFSPGTTLVRSWVLTMPALDRSSAVAAVTDRGTSWSLPAHRCAVTTTSAGSSALSGAAAGAASVVAADVSAASSAKAAAGLRTQQDMQAHEITLIITIPLTLNLVIDGCAAR